MNRGRHRKQTKHFKTYVGYALIRFKYTLQGRKCLKNISLDKLYRVYTNKYNEVWRIEEDIKNQNNI